MLNMYLRDAEMPYLENQIRVSVTQSFLLCRHRRVDPRTIGNIATVQGNRYCGSLGCNQVLGGLQARHEVLPSRFLVWVFFVWSCGLWACQCVREHQTMRSTPLTTECPIQVVVLDRRQKRRSVRSMWNLHKLNRVTPLA